MSAAEQDQKETSYRRIVLTTIENLIDVENIAGLESHLKHLHGLGWDEVIEERFVNKQCGFPTCPRTPPKNTKPQMYQIDKKEGKIYEYCKQRNKFCSEHCYHRSFFVRNQLDEQPLWITGECQQRMDKKYEVPDDTFVSPAPEVKKSSDLKMDQEPSIEFVADSIIAQVSNMKLNEEIEEPKITEEEEPQQEPYKLSEDDKDFIQSIRQFRSSTFAPAVNIKKPSRPRQVKLTERDKAKEDEILAKLRAKYGNKNAQQKKPPILIEAPPMNQKTAVTENRSTNSKHIWLLSLVKSWFTLETRRMILEGARPSGGTAEQIMMDFLSGNKVDTENLVKLPNLDKYNIKEKRLNIFLHSIRHHWLELESRLQVTSTRRDLLSRVAATFNLDSENITGWNKNENQAISLVLFLVLCLIDVELGDDYFNENNASPELSAAASDLCGIESTELSSILAFIKFESLN